MNPDLVAELAAIADELTDPRRHVEVLGGWDHNRNRKTVRRITTVPSLLDQLQAAVIPGGGYAEDETATHAAFGSRPPARIDAIDRLLAIDAASARWSTSLALKLRTNTTANIRALLGANLDSDTRSALLDEMTAWRNWAATVTGWQRPPDAPRAPCPVCESRASLRVRLDRQTGCCLACGASWDARSIGVLAEHVRGYNQAPVRAAWRKDARLRERQERARVGAA